MKRKELIYQIFWFVLENGPIVITIIFAAYVVALAQVSTLPTDVILSWMLAILGLLAISELIERLRTLRRLEENTTRTLKAVESKFGERASADDFFLIKLPPIRAYLEKAQDIRLCGITLQRFTRENFEILAKRLSEGASIKIIILDPNGVAIQQLLKTGSNLTLGGLRANINLTIERLRWLAHLPESTGRIWLRFADEDIRFNVLAFDPEKEYGTIFVEFYPQRWSIEGRPRVELNTRRDEKWFKYFKNQFERLWDDCKPIDLEIANE